MLIAHEWVAAAGGSENVFRALLHGFPSADGVCLWNDAPETLNREIRETGLASLPLRRHKAVALPFMPAAWRAVDLDAYDVVLASSHAFAHHLASRAAREGRSAYAYVHTPARYLWAPEVERRGRGAAARFVALPLRAIDRRAVDSRVQYAANSRFVQERIYRAWGVQASVIHPPIDVERISSVDDWRSALTEEEERLFEALPQGPFVLGASRLVGYKRLDLALVVGDALDLPVVVAGFGPDEPRLRSMAKQVRVPVTFTGRVSDAQLFALYQAAALFVFLPIEDFGIMPLEAVAAGTPTLVNSAGGAREGVMLVEGGQEVDAESGPRELARAAEAAMRSDMTRAAAGIQEFSRASFDAAVKSWVGKAAGSS